MKRIEIYNYDLMLNSLNDHLSNVYNIIKNGVRITYATCDDLCSKCWLVNQMGIISDEEIERIDKELNKLVCK